MDNVGSLRTSADVTLSIVSQTNIGWLFVPL